MTNFLATQYHRQFLTSFDPNQIQDRPLPLKGLLIQKLDGKDIDSDGTAGQTSFLTQMDKEFPDFLLAELSRGPTVMPGQILDSLQVDLLSAGGQTPQLHVRDHSTSQFSHRNAPFHDSIC